jgi:hypothetical protein
MHRTRNADDVGAAPTGGSNGGYDVRAASGSVKAVVSGANPTGLPTFHRAQGKGVEPSVCKTDLPGASPGCASISYSAKA